jgi:hypothetical protein
MLQKEIKFLNQIRKKLHCQEQGCGKNITFEVSENDVEFLSDEKIKFRGKCSKCLGTITIKSTDWIMFNRLMGDAKLVAVKSTFNSLFDDGEEDDA